MLPVISHMMSIDRTLMITKLDSDHNTDGSNDKVTQNKESVQ